MITMCCEVSYLYIGLLTQLSYLIYVGFLNSCLYNILFVLTFNCLKMLGVAENHKIIEIYNFVLCNVTRLDLDRPLGMDETTLIMYGRSPSQNCD